MHFHSSWDRSQLFPGNALQYPVYCPRPRLCLGLMQDIELALGYNYNLQLQEKILLILYTIERGLRTKFNEAYIMSRKRREGETVQ